MAVAKVDFTSFLNQCVQLTVHLSDMLLESGMFYAITVSVNQLLGMQRVGPNVPRTLHSSVSSCTCRGSRLSRRVPSNMAGSWGIMARRPRRSDSPIVEISRPSILQKTSEIAKTTKSGSCSHLMLPPAASMIRKSARVNELFPAPVRPTTPIFS